ncbi:MAG: carbohydrate kinase family protein [Anaerolineaceae bacterium]
MARNPHIKLLIAGELTRDFIINLSGKAINNIPGGSLVYAAAGARLWTDDIGLIGRAPSDYPSDWLSKIENRGLDTGGITLTGQNVDTRRLYYWRDSDNCSSDNPVAGYARYGITFPQDLLGYTSASSAMDEQLWKNINLRLNPSFPPEYLDTSGAHICPLSMSTHIQLTALFQHGLSNTITISPSDDYMNPQNWISLPSIIKGISAFFPTESQISSLFLGRSKDLWEMAEGLSEMGCPLVIIQRAEKGYLMYDAANQRRVTLPFYPTHWLDPTGIKDVFAGSFLAEYKKNYDPLQALIAGSTGASLAVEGTGAFYCLDGFPGLETARREVIQSMLTIN